MVECMLNIIERNFDILFKYNYNLKCLHSILRNTRWLLERPNIFSAKEHIQ